MGKTVPFKTGHVKLIERF